MLMGTEDAPTGPVCFGGTVVSSQSNPVSRLNLIFQIYSILKDYVQGKYIKTEISETNCGPFFRKSYDFHGRLHKDPLSAGWISKASPVLWEKARYV